MQTNTLDMYNIYATKVEENMYVLCTYLKLQVHECLFNLLDKYKIMFLYFSKNLRTCNINFISKTKSWGGGGDIFNCLPVKNL